MDAHELKVELAQYYGGDENVYRHALNAKFNYTAGMKALFSNAGGGAYWLSDILATEPAILNGVKQHGFCVGVLDSTGGSAGLTVAVDYDSETKTFLTPVFTRFIPVTDFPEGHWKFYLTYTTVGSFNVVMALLPREY